jgi:hypothetical protein
MPPNASNIVGRQCHRVVSAHGGVIRGQENFKGVGQLPHALLPLARKLSSSALPDGDDGAVPRW